MTAQRQWTFPLPDQKGDFVFMAVDVIKHTDMLEEALNESRMAFRSVDAALLDLPDHISASIEWYNPDLRWDWAGDGGIYAFPITYGRGDTFNVYEYVIRCAERILNGLDEFNAHHERTTRPVKLRITIDSGDAVYRKDQAFCRGLALNIAAKLKVADDENSIAITRNLYREFMAIPSLKDCFVPISVGEAADPAQPVTYVHGDFAKQSFALKGSRHLAKRQFVFAAHCAFLEFTVDLGRFYLETADDAIRRAIEYTRAEEPDRYFSRTLLAFFEGWRSIVTAMRSKDLAPRGDTGDRLLFLSDEAVLAHLRGVFGEERIRLMRAVEYIQEQFDLMARRYIGAPRSLAVLEMAGLLARAGFSPLHAKQALDRQIDVFLKEIESHGWAIDDGCTLCTGKALSVLALADAAPDVQGRVKNWLAGFEQERFCVLEENYTGAGRDEHSMHYAASVAHALMDARDDGKLLDRVLGAFFPSRANTADALLEFWLMWRSEATFWIGAHIFSTFLWLMQHPRYSRALDPWKEQIAGACAIYVKALKDDARIAGVRQTAFLYAIRENLAALNTGRLLGVDGCAEPLAEVLMIFDRKVERTIERHRREAAAAPNRARQRYPFDSSIDRTVRFIDNWLRYFESVLSENSVSRQQE